MTLEVLRCGPLALIQDAGRFGHADLGVGASGAADRGSYRTANRVVGNAPGAATIECVLGGLVLLATQDGLVAVTGADAPVTVDGEPAERGQPIAVRAGQRIRLGTPRSGLRSYLAVAGGVDVPAVLGSRSTDTLSGLGPAALRRGDLLPIGSHPQPVGSEPALALTPLPAGGITTLRVTTGPRADWFVAPTDLAVGQWVVSADSNRVGLRLDRPPDAADGDAPGLRRLDGRELPSEGLVLGAVQVPPSGQPALFLADHPVTGGYPVIAVVRTADVDRAAQLRPGQLLRFRFDPAVLPPT